MSTFRSLWDAVFCRNTRRRPSDRRKATSNKMLCELLEDRIVPATVTIATLQNGYENGDNGVFRVTRDDATGPLLVLYAVDTANSTAISGTDYGALSGVVLMDPGVSYADISVAAFDDGAVEAPETLAVNLQPSYCQGAPVYTIGSQGCASLTLSDDPYIDYLAALSNPSQEYSSDIQNELTTYNMAIDDANNTAQTEVDSAYADYLTGFSSATQTFRTADNNVQSTFNASAQQAISDAQSGISPGMAPIASAINGTEANYNTAEQGAIDACQQSEAAADATYQNSIAPLQTALDAAQANANANPDDPDAQSALTQAQQDLADGEAQATAIQNAAYDAAIAQETGAAAGADQAWQNDAGTADSSGAAVTGTAENTFNSELNSAASAAATNENAADQSYVGAEQSAWGAYQGSLSSDNAQLQNSASNAQSTLTQAATNDLVAWNAAETAAWNTYNSVLGAQVSHPPAQSLRHPARHSTLADSQR